jgi:DNA polymerase
MQELHLDFETYSELNIKKVGAYRYAQHPSTEVLLAGYSIDKSPTKIWDALASKTMPADLRRAFKSPHVRIHAFNAQFERLILKHVLNFEIPIPRFRCAMIHAYGFGFVGSLEEVGPQLYIEKGKITAGKELIRLFCKPRKPTKNKPYTRVLPKHEPQKWEQFKQYCIRDVDVEIDIEHRLQDYPLPDIEWDNWFFDQEINDLGIPLDMELVDKAIALNEDERHEVLNRIGEITNLENPNSKAQLRTWFKQCGLHLPNMQHATLVEYEEKTRDDPAVNEVLNLYLRVTKNAASKYDKMKAVVLENNTVCGGLQFLGAQRTGRWAGRLIQPQNFVRTPNGFVPEKSIEMILNNTVNQDVSEHLAAALRGAICAFKGEIFAIADLAGIEGGVLPWLCFFDEKVDKIRSGRDMYLVAASDMYGIPYDSLTKRSPERMPGKVAELALQYEGGYRALNSMAVTLGIPPFEEVKAKQIVRDWRRANVPVERFWKESETSAKAAVMEPNRLFSAGRIGFICDETFLFMVLPSGRVLSYFEPLLTEGKISYMGWDSYKRKWKRIDTYGGKLVENATQATSRDVLVYGMHRAREKYFKIFMTIHDEIATRQRKLKKFTHEALVECMTYRPPWAEGLPLSASGYTEQRFKKD